MSKIYTQLRQIEKQKESKFNGNIGCDEPISSNRVFDNHKNVKTKTFWVAVSIIAVLFAALLVSSLGLYGMTKQYSAERKFLLIEIAKLKLLLNKSTEQTGKNTEAVSQALVSIDEKIKKINAGITDLQKKQAISAAALEKLKQTQDIAIAKPVS